MITLLSAGVDSLSLITTQNGASVVTAFNTDISGVYNGTRQLAAITSATTTTIVTAPGSGSIDVEHVNILNTYAGSHTITVQLNNNGTLFAQKVVTLAENESFEYNHGTGWRALDANGAAKVGTAGWVIAAGKIGTLSNSITFAGTDGTTMTFPSTSATIARTDAAQTFDGTQTFSGLIQSVKNADGPNATFNNGGNANYIEFSKTGYTVKGSIGALGGFEMNISANMDYSTDVHRFYDNTVGANWLAISSDGMYLQYAPATAAAGDVWAAGGSLINWKVVANGNQTVRGAGFFGGSVYVGDTANAFNTLGLTVNQGANDDEIFSMKSSDIAHGMTSLAETDTYAMFGKWSPTLGGLMLMGYSEGPTGFAFVARTTTEDTTKADASVGYIVFGTQIKNGTTTTNPGADANLFVVRNGSTARFIFDAEGTLHSNGATSMDTFGNGVISTANATATVYNTAATTVNAFGAATTLAIGAAGGSSAFAGSVSMAEMTAPTGVANVAKLYAEDNGAGKTKLMCKLGDDVAIQIAIQA